MKAYTLLSLGLAAIFLSACATDPTPPQVSNDSAILVEDMGQNGYYYGQGSYPQGQVQVGLDPDGAVTVGDPYAVAEDVTPGGFQGPSSLRENNTIYFKYDSEQIIDEYVAIMQSHAQYLRDNPDSRIIIEGHTDERGTPEYNIALGERRARSVARYMQNLGVDINQLSIVSYGEEKPVLQGHDDNAWRKNRRAVINY